MKRRMIKVTADMEVNENLTNDLTTVLLKHKVPENIGIAMLQAYDNEIIINAIRTGNCSKRVEEEYQ